MASIRWLFTLALLGGVACGPVNQAPVTTADGGAGSSGGSSADAGSGTSGVPDAGAGGGGTGGSDAGAGSGGGSDGGGSGGGGGGGSGGGGSHACDGLMPGSIGAMRSWQEMYGTSQGGTCGFYEGDSNGVVSLEYSDNGHPRWDFISPTGTRVGNASAWRGELFPGASGFVLYGWSSDYESGWINFFDESGHASGNSAVVGHPVTVSDSRGGLLMAGQLGTPRRNQVWSIDGAGQTRWGPRPLGSQGTVFGGGVDLRGYTLVFLDGGPGNIDAQWFAPDGAPATGVFRLLNGFVPGPSTWFETSPLLDGGVAVRRVDGTEKFTGWRASWLMILRAGSTAADPAPDWLTSRPDTRFEVTRGGRAYAFLPYGRPGSCSQRVELLAPDGESCGGFDLTMSNGSCTTYDLNLGLDGTLLQRQGKELEQDTGAARSCTVRFWPAALR